jgi:hypothetical protein
MDWKNKYLKYKNKYLQLKYGGAPEAIVKTDIYDKQSEVVPCDKNFSNFSDIDFNYLQTLYDKYKLDVNQPSATFRSFIEYKTLQLSLFTSNNPSTLTKKYIDDLFDEFIRKGDRIVDANGIIINKRPEVEALKNHYLTFTINTLDDLRTIFSRLQRERLIIEMLQQKILYPVGSSNKIEYWWNVSVVEPTNRFNKYLNRLKLDPSTGHYIIQPQCQKIDKTFNIYFVDDTIKRIIYIPTNTILPNSSPTLYNDLLLDPSKYINCIQNGIHNKLIDQSAICLEGNYVYADHLSKIASGSITSCLFMCIFLKDNSVLVSHFNGILANDDFKTFISGLGYIDNQIELNDYIKFSYTHDNCISIINQKFGSIINNISHIFIGGILDDYQITSNGFKYRPEPLNSIRLSAISNNIGIIRGWFRNPAINVYFDKKREIMGEEKYHYIVTNNNVFFIE